MKNKLYKYIDFYSDKIKRYIKEFNNESYEQITNINNTKNDIKWDFYVNLAKENVDIQMFFAKHSNSDIVRDMLKFKKLNHKTIEILLQRDDISKELMKKY